MYADSSDNTKITQTVRKKENKQTNKNDSAIYQLCQSMPGTRQGQGMDKQGQAGTSMDKQGHALSVSTCPCLTFSVPVRFYICYTFMSTPADEYDIHCQYGHRYIDFPCKNHCCTACKTCLQLLRYFSSFSSSITFLFNSTNFFLGINIKKGSTWFL